MYTPLPISLQLLAIICESLAIDCERYQSIASG
jgi:hypothetical protein